MTDHRGSERPARRRVDGPRWMVLASMAAILGLVAIGLALASFNTSDAESSRGESTERSVSSTPPPTDAPDTTTSSPGASDDVPPTTARSIPRPTGVRPARVTIPAIGVDAPTVALDLSGPEPEVPSDFDDAGWYEQTRRPGEIGPAVLAGHIDSKTGPAVFFELDQLGEGDEITVSDVKGESRTFAVVGSGQYLKDELPPEVFAFDQPEPELRLITCGGVFDRESGHYQDNYVVYARAVPR